MDKCREEFEEYFKEHHADSFYSVDVALEMRGDDYIDFLASDLWAIWQHQQAKVEELQTLYTQQGINMLKLQKRVDALELKLREIAGIARRARHGEYHTESGRNAGLNIAAEIEQALNGECKHESDGSFLLSDPPRTKCKKCGEFYSAHELKEGDQ